MMGDDLEIIVVDDDSSDISAMVMEAYGEGVRLIKNETNMGLPASVNTGIRASRGMYVLRLDADDWLDRNAAYFLSYALDHNKDKGFVWPDYYVYDSNETVIGRKSDPLGAGIMFRKQLLVKVGLYDEDMLTHEDKDILIRCLKEASGLHLPLPLYRYFRHDTNMTNVDERLLYYGKKLEAKHGHQIGLLDLVKKDDDPEE